MTIIGGQQLTSDDGVGSEWGSLFWFLSLQESLTFRFAILIYFWKNNVWVSVYKFIGYLKNGECSVNKNTRICVVGTLKTFLKGETRNRTSQRTTEGTEGSFALYHPTGYVYPVGVTCIGQDGAKYSHYKYVARSIQ